VDDTHIQRLTPSALAFVGDAAQTLYIRKRLVGETDSGCGTLHTAASKYVNAKAQAAAFDELERRGVFTEAESDIARRARNAHLHIRANATPKDYHKATALEAVIGYLELTGDTSRRDMLLELTFTLVNESK